MFNQLWRLIFRIRFFFRNIPRRKVTASEILVALDDYPGVEVALDDAEYWIVTPQVMDMLIGLDWTDQHEYHDELQDCDDYALAFKVHMQEFFGKTGVGVFRDPDSLPVRHIYNIVVLDTSPRLTARLFEPQTDEWVERGSRRYPAQHGRMQF